MRKKRIRIAGESAVRPLALVLSTPAPWDRGRLARRRHGVSFVSSALASAWFLVTPRPNVGGQPLANLMLAVARDQTCGAMRFA